MSKKFDKDEAAHTVIQGIFDEDAIFNETFNRLKADPALKARLDAYNAACEEYTGGDGSTKWDAPVDEHVNVFDVFEAAYFEEVFNPVANAVMVEILQRAIEICRE